MSDVKNLYILKQPVEVDYKERVVSLTWPGSGIEEILSAENFDKDFVRLDVESLTTQLETIIKKAVINAKKVDMSPLNEANALLGITQIGVAEVLELLGMKGKDND